MAKRPGPRRWLKSPIFWILMSMAAIVAFILLADSGWQFKNSYRLF